MLEFELESAIADSIECGPLAQLAEQGTLNPKVGGSKPSRPTGNRGLLFGTVSSLAIMTDAANFAL